MSKLDTTLKELDSKRPPCKTEGFRPERTRGARKFDHAPHSGHERIHLLIFNHQWWSHFQHHEVIPADLSQKSKITQQPHHQNLREHSAMDSRERLVRNPQAQLRRAPGIQRP